LDIKAPDLPRPRGPCPLFAGRYVWNLVIGAAGACLGLRQSTVSLPGPPEAIVPHGARSAGDCGCLNWNLMAPKSHRLTLAFDGSSREADNVSSFVHTTARTRYYCRAIYVPAEQTN
jgi:hypothetical protein